MMRDGNTVTERLPYDTETMSEQGIDLVAIVVAIVSEWKVGLVAFVICAALGLWYVNSLKSQFVASATFLPQEGRTETAGLTSIFQVSGPGPLYMGLLRSRSVQDDVVEKAGLLQLWNTQDHELARAILGGKSSFSQGADGIMTVSVRDENSEIAARIANAYLIGLQDLSDKMAQGQANQSRHFFDQQLEQEREKLEEAEQNLIRMQERTGAVASGAQASEGIGNIAGFRGQIDGLKVQLAVLKQSESDDNPDVQRIRSQIAQLQAEERSQETGQGKVPVGAAIPAAQAPILNLELSHAEAEVASRQASVSALTSQAGSARSDATLSHPVFEIIDPAIPPEFRVWPPHQQYVTAAFGFAAVMALASILVWIVLKRILSNPVHRASLTRLRRAI